MTNHSTSTAVPITHRTSYTTYMYQPLSADASWTSRVTKQHSQKPALSTMMHCLKAGTARKQNTSPQAVNASHEMPAQHGPLEARLVTEGEKGELQHQVVSAQESCHLPEYHKNVQHVPDREDTCSNHQG